MATQCRVKVFANSFDQGVVGIFKNKSISSFILFSTLSTFGDSLLLFAIPTGLGIDTNDLRAMVIMFLVPGIAIFLSTYLHRFIAKRISSSLNDYSKLLIVIGILELFISLLCLILEDYRIALCAVFVAVYAFAKEGIPRIFYSIDVYSYITDPHNRGYLVSQDQGWKIFGFFMGVVSAGFLIEHSSWEFALIIDSITFCLFGLYLSVIAKKNRSPTNQSPQGIQDHNLATHRDSNLGIILILIPIVSFSSCLYSPYLTLLSKKWNLLDTSSVIYVIGCISAFTMTINLYLFKNRLNQKIALFFVVSLPILSIISGMTLLYMRNMAALIFSICATRMYASLFFTCDFFFRSKLNKVEQIQFNTKVTRSFSACQVLACSIAFIIINKAQYEEIALKLHIPLLLLALTFPLISSSLRSHKDR